MEDQSRISVLVSGFGSNLQALIDAQANELNNSKIIRVASNRKAAFALERAAKAGIPTSYHNLVEYKKRYPESIEKARSEYDHEVAVALRKDQPDIVVMAGWMHVVTSTFLELLAAAKVPVINLHPALPGAYNGAGAIERAHKDWLEGRVDRTGIMIHYVISEVDMGEPILVKEIPFIRGVDEDIEKLRDRIHEEEHKAIVTGTKIALSRISKTTIGSRV